MAQVGLLRLVSRCAPKPRALIGRAFWSWLNLGCMVLNRSNEWPMDKPTLGVGGTTQKACSLDGQEGKGGLLPASAACCLPHLELFLCDAPLPWSQPTMD